MTVRRTITRVLVAAMMLAGTALALSGPSGAQAQAPAVGQVVAVRVPPPPAAVQADDSGLLSESRSFPTAPVIAGSVVALGGAWLLHAQRRARARRYRSVALPAWARSRRTTRR